ncbi:hypothetical protein [Mycoplasma mycoides]|nr:hypothetical protein [Mycoplasma mycoides]
MFETLDSISQIQKDEEWIKTEKQRIDKLIYEESKNYLDRSTQT